MKIQTKTDTPREHFADFRSIATLLCATLHPALFMHNASLDDAVPDRFSNDVFCVLLRIQVELDADISKGYA